MKRRNFFAALGAIPLAAMMKPKEAKDLEATSGEVRFDSDVDIRGRSDGVYLYVRDGVPCVASSRASALEIQSGIPLERV